MCNTPNASQIKNEQRAHISHSFGISIRAIIQQQELPPIPDHPPGTTLVTEPWEETYPGSKTLWSCTIKVKMKISFSLSLSFFLHIKKIQTKLHFHAKSSEVLFLQAYIKMCFYWKTCRDCLSPSLSPGPFISLNTSRNCVYYWVHLPWICLCSQTPMRGPMGPGTPKQQGTQGWGILGVVRLRFFCLRGFFPTPFIMWPPHPKQPGLQHSTHCSTSVQKPNKTTHTQNHSSKHRAHLAFQTTEDDSQPQPAGVFWKKNTLEK